MKIRSFLLTVLAAILGLTACHSGDEFKQMRKDFTDPPAEFRSVPFWVWNDVVSEEMIDRQLEDFKKHGFGGVFVHPRYGLITEYASEEWFEFVQYAVRKAKKLDLKLWLYDENSYPSGFGGGLVPAEMPSSYNEGHALKLHSQKILQPDSEKEYLNIYNGDIDITDNVDSLTGTAGDFLLVELKYFPVSDWYAGYSYVDLLKPGVTDKFIEVTMTGYEDKIENEFGKTVPGIFTDEPHIAPMGNGPLIRWTPDLYEQFEKRWGYKLESHLLSLVENVGDYKTVRHNYYQLMLDLFIERWSIPWFEYATDKNLEWTGHYWEHGWPSPADGPDNMAMYAWHQVPGIDMLFNNWEKRPDQFGNVRAVRELNSIGNQLGRKRKLSETYGASGWELTFEEMKRNGDWQYVLGVNLMNQHLSFQTIVGERKHDHPQSFSRHAPYWDEYSSLADYYARLSYALSSGRQDSKVMVIEPTTSAWLSYGIGEKNYELQELDDDFTSLLDLLESEQVEYDLGSERVINDHGRIEDGKFFVGIQGYTYVVIPDHMENINKRTVELIEEFMSLGGNVLVLRQVPTYIDGIQNERCSLWQQKYPEHCSVLNGLDDPRFINLLLSDEFILVEQSGGDLYHHRRLLEDGQLLFLVNSDLYQPCETRFLMQGNDIARMDPMNGAIMSYPCVVTSGILSFDAEIPPGGSILLYISNNELRTPRTKSDKWRGGSVALSLSDIEVTPSSENVITLDYCKLLMQRDTTELIYYYDAQTRVFQTHGFDRNPWVSSSQFKTSIIDRDTFSLNSGFEVIYPFFLDSRTPGQKMTLVVERPELYKVFINGHPIDPVKGKWWLDENFGIFDLTGMILEGANMVTVKAHPMSVHCEVQPVYLLGDFELIPRKQGWILGGSNVIGIGSWKKQGFPFYHDKMVYTSRVQVDSRGPGKVVLPDWYGTLATVEINGNMAGQIFGSPGEIRVDNFLKRGENVVKVTVFGSLKNLLGPHHYVTSRGIVTPRNFKSAPGTQPSGEGYDLLDYGLMEPFQVHVTDR